MADAILYYRTPTSRQDQYALPTTSGFPAGQKLTFTFSDNIMEAIQFSYENNIVDIPAPISDGTRKINKQENGLKDIKLIIKGRFKKPKDGSGNPILDTDIGKLITFSRIAQLDASHPFGIIGFFSPNAPEFSIDPNATGASTPATKGLTIQGWDLGYMTPKVTSYDFRMTLSFGGTWA